MTRLVHVAQKYNPVRAFTAEGTVGLGGPLLVSKFLYFRSRQVWETDPRSLSVGVAGRVSILGKNNFNMGCKPDFLVNGCMLNLVDCSHTLAGHSLIIHGY
jgi:hypothetical protein